MARGWRWHSGSRNRQFGAIWRRVWQAGFSIVHCRPLGQQMGHVPIFCLRWPAVRAQQQNLMQW